jgi:KaiC/GvpD/RAD55 family RecA-like ATPase
MNKDKLLVSSFTKLLLVGEISTLLFLEPSLKTLFLLNIISEYVKEGKRVIVLDLDSKVSGYLKSSLIRIPNEKNILIYLPSENEVEDYVAKICSIKEHVFSILIFDSISTYYHISGGKDFGELNRRLSTLITVLKNYALKNSSPLLLTSMYKARKPSTQEWILSPSGGRVVIKRSSCLFDLVKKYENKVLVKISRHKLKRWDKKELQVSLSIV